MKLGSKMVRNGALLGAAVAVAALSSQAHAALILLTGPSFTLAQLAPSGGNTPGFQIGDLIFYNFQVFADTGDSPNPAAVTVTPETLAVGTQSTVGFNIGGGFNDTPGSPGASDFSLHYNVATADGSAEITDAHIFGNPSVFGAGFAAVTETWTPDVTTSYNKVFDIEPGGATQLAGVVNFSQAYSSLSVQKDIQLQVPNAPATGNVATISSIDQTYSEVNGNGRTPEPASLGLLGLGMMGLVARRRRDA